jgi:hypothetical protein
MRTYDPADRIAYVHLAERPAATAPPRATDECTRLVVGYANESLRARLGEPAPAPFRPALVVLPGGALAADSAGPPTPALRLAR